MKNIVLSTIISALSLSLMAASGRMATEDWTLRKLADATNGVYEASKAYTDSVVTGKVAEADHIYDGFYTLKADGTLWTNGVRVVEHENENVLSTLLKESNEEPNSDTNAEERILVYCGRLVTTNEVEEIVKCDVEHACTNFATKAWVKDVLANYIKVQGEEIIIDIPEDMAVLSGKKDGGAKGNVAPNGELDISLCGGVTIGDKEPEYVRYSVYKAKVDELEARLTALENALKSK